MIVLTADKFEDFELCVPYFRMMEEGVAVDVAAPAKETLTLEDTQQRRDNVVSLASRR